MASLREIRQRIKSVENINGITKAMELISAVRYKKIDKRYKGAIPYYETLESLIDRIISPERIAGNPLFEVRPVKKELVVVITGDRGLCGGFNSLIVKEFMRYQAQNKDRQIVPYVVGKVGKSQLQNRKVDLFDSWTDVGYDFTLSSIKEKIDRLTELYLTGEFDAVNILCNAGSRSGAYSQKMEPFLNLSYLLKNESNENKSEGGYIFEPEAEGVVNSLVDLFVRQRFYTYLLRSVSAEYFARMLAMKTATDNGREMIEDLTLLRNKVRQAMITRELSEIIGGSEALN
ncbi:MAG: ATP synthase F1 subunit gamma [Candidatus Omnitrophica bacterium]|nr:ATP synthase F1 subunit gamma [Candidatus Omnitrophota bacterium]